MISINDHKTPMLMDPWHFLGPKRRERLEGSWAGLFRQEILPVLPVDKLAKCFTSGRGRPGKELHTALGALVLQQQFDLTDVETVQQLAFDTRWHYALNLTDDSDFAKYMCERTLWGLREWATENGLVDILFDRVTGRLAEVFSVDPAKQRLDSTHTKSNMKRLGRIRIFSRAIRAFLVNLKRHFREVFEALPEGLSERFLSKGSDSLFSMVKPSESEKTLKTLAGDLRLLVERFRDNADVERMNSYRALSRVFAEQCQVVEGKEGGPVTVEVKPSREIASGSLQNPSDPDAGYSGHKGQGYTAQVMETYSEEKTPTTLNLLTYAEVTAANVSDAGAVVPAVEAVEARGMAPQTLLADSLYGGDENLQAVAEKGVELVSPVMGHAEKSGIRLSDFEYGDKGEVVRCPMGQAPVKVTCDKETDHRKAAFDAAACRACPRQGECPAKPGKKRYTLHYTERALRSSKRRATEQTEGFRDRYRFRSGIEATMSELDRRTGVKRLRVRGLSAVRFCVKMKVLGLNILRAAAVRAARLAEAAREACAEKAAGEAAAVPETSFSAIFVSLFVALGVLFSIFRGLSGKNRGRTDFRFHPARNSPPALFSAA